MPYFWKPHAYIVDHVGWMGIRQQRVIVPPALVPYRQAIVEWWDSPIGTVAPVLHVVSSDPADRSALIDSFVEEITRVNERLAGGQVIDWWDLKPDGLRANMDDPAGSLRTLLDSIGAGAGRARDQFGGASMTRADRVVLVTTAAGDELTGEGWADLSAPLAKVMGDRSLVDRAGMRLIVARDSIESAIPAGGTEMPRVVVLPYIQRRTALVDRIDEWARDPRAEPMLVVRGHPGSGKTELLAAVARRFARESADGLPPGKAPGIRLGYHLLRGPGDARLHMEELVEQVAWAVAEDGFILGGRGGAEVHSTVAAQIVHERATVIGTAVGTMKIERSLLTVGELCQLLQRRADDVTHSHPAIVLIIDAINELAEIDPRALAELDSLLDDTWQLRAWGVKVLVSSHDESGRRPSQAIDLNTDSDAEQDLHSFVLHRLELLAVPDAELAWYVRRIVELSGGLFLVANGYLDEIGHEPAARRSAWLQRAFPARSAADYFSGAIRRALGTVSQQQRVLDQERFLRILALTRWGMTTAEMAGIWNAQPDGVVPAGSSDFGEVRELIRFGPVARYIAAPEDPAHGRYRLLHPSVREALLRVRAPRNVEAARIREPGYVPPAHSGVNLTAERRRFLHSLTPLGGRGPAWDAEDGRMALASVLDVIRDLIADAVDDIPPDLSLRDTGLDALRAVVEDWSWLESCVTHGQEDADIPLGVEIAVTALQRLCELNSPWLNTAEPILWVRPELPTLVQPTRPVPPAPLPEPQAEAAADVAATAVTRTTTEDADNDREPAPPTLPEASPGPVTPSPAIMAARRGPSASLPVPRRTGPPKYLSTNVPYGRQLLSGLDIQPSREHAEAALVRAARHYTRARPPIGGDDPDQVVLWIRGLVTADEAKQGYRGNYARLVVVPASAGRWMVKAEKLDIPLRSHPEKDRERLGNPDWGHKTIRLAEGNPHGSKPKIYRTRAIAEEKLAELKREYPRSAHVPGTLFINVFTSGVKGVTPIRLQIQERSGGYVLVINRRTPAARDEG
jgi:hypothetical protein